MSKHTIIDDVFIGEQKHCKKLSTNQIIGGNKSYQRTYQRFYSNQFIPFQKQRDVKGKIIKNGNSQFINNEKLSSVWQLSKNTNVSFDLNNTHNVKLNNNLIETKFKFNQVHNFRQSQYKSHFDNLVQFKKDVQRLENKDYQKKYKKAKREEEIWEQNFHKIMGINDIKRLNEQEKEHNGGLFRLTLKDEGIQLGRKPSRSASLQNIKSQKTKIKQPKSGTKSFKPLLNHKPHRNPQLQQIQRNVKVHFNHPELDRLKQSRKLQFKFVDNIQQGDKKFKFKIQQYRQIRENIKKEMSKF